ncbi:MAG: sulfatase-like hydrolase/transferase [bacterium]
MRERISKFIDKSILRNGLTGSLTYGLFYLFCIFDQKSFSYMGVKSEAGKDVITDYFLPAVIFSQAKVLLSYLLLGFTFGILVHFFWKTVLSETYLRSRLFNKLLMEIISLFLLEFYFLTQNILKYPALYSEFFYEKGGLRKTFQVFITDNFNPFFYNIIALSVLLVFAFFLFKKAKTQTRISAGIFILALLAVYGLTGLKNNYADKPVSGPNIIIVGSDSLRRDHIIEKIAPNIFKLGREGVTFSNFFVSLPRTLPQWITYLTSTYPAEHGVRNMFPEKSLREHEEGSLNAVLEQNGYRTAVVSDFAGDIFTRLKIGFDIVKAPYFNFNTVIEQRGLEIHYLLLPYLTNSCSRKIFPVIKEFANNADPFLLEKEAEKTIREMKGKFFLCVFFSTTHFPYASVYPYYKFYADKKYSGPYKYYKPNIPGEPVTLPDEDLKQVRALYAQAVACTDDAFGRLRLFLQKNNLDKNTIIVVLADHGEQLYENGYGQGHGEHLRGREVLNVPFIIYDPREKFKAQTVDEIVRDIDLSPTLLSMLSLPWTETMEGTSLLPLMRGEKTGPRDTFAETGLWFTDKGDKKQRIMYPDIVSLGSIDTEYNNEVVIRPEYRDLTNIAKHRMVLDGRYKLIYIPTRDGVFFELYDTEKDPDELNNLADLEPGKLAELKTRLFAWMEKDKNGLWKNGYYIHYP